jgi:hypothetical protein
MVNTLLRRIHRPLENFLDVATRHYGGSAVLLSLTGFLLLYLSIVLNIAFVEFRGLLHAGIKIDNHIISTVAHVPDLEIKAKQVGYFAAPNWFLFGAVLLPAIIGICLWLRSTMEPTLRDLAHAGMARDSALEPISGDSLVERWRQDRRGAAFIPIVVFLAVFSYAGYDFITSVGPPIWGSILSASNPITGLPTGQLTIHDPVFEYDWSIACLFPGARVVGGCGANLAFDLLAYLIIPGFGVAFIFATIVEAILFIFFAVGSTPSAPATDRDGRPLPQKWELVAMPHEKSDDLCGFKAFEPFFSAILSAALVIMPSLIFVILQNSYLRDPTSSNVFAFIADDLDPTIKSVSSFAHDHDLSRLTTTLLTSSKGTTLVNPNTSLGLVVFLFVVIFALLATYAVLRRSAKAAKDLAYEEAPRLSAELNLPEQEFRNRLDRMRFWPLGWMSLNQTMSIVAFMSFAVYSYRLTLLPVVLGVLFLIIGVTKGLMPNKNSNIKAQALQSRASGRRRARPRHPPD